MDRPRGARTVPGFSREVGESRIKVASLIQFEMLVTRIADEANLSEVFPGQRVQIGRRGVMKRYFDVWQDCVDTAVRVLNLANLLGADSVCCLFEAVVWRVPVAESPRCQGLRDEQQLENVDQWVWRVMDRDYTEPGAVPFPSVMTVPRECQFCRGSHSWRDERCFEAAPPVLLVAAEGVRGSLVWFPLEWQAIGLTARECVTYHLVSYVKCIVPGHHVAVTRGEAAGFDWALYDDAEVRWDYRPRVEPVFYRTRIAFRFTLGDQRLAVSCPYMMEIIGAAFRLFG
jgi:hypothetical protein